MPSTDITSYSYFYKMYDLVISFDLSYLNIRVITQPTIRAPTHPGGVRLSPHTVSTIAYHYSEHLYAIYHYA